MMRKVRGALQTHDLGCSASPILLRPSLERRCAAAATLLESPPCSHVSIVRWAACDVCSFREEAEIRGPFSIEIWGLLRQSFADSIVLVETLRTSDRFHFLEFFNFEIIRSDEIYYGLPEFTFHFW